MVDEKLSPLFRAALDGDTESAAILLNQGADISARDVNGYTALHYAVTAGPNRPDRVAVAELLLDWEADPNALEKRGNTPLMLALKQKQKSYRAMALLLLSRGGDPHGLKDAGFAPLHAATYYGDAVVVEHLLLYGAEVNARNRRGETPLHDAARKNREDVTQVLLSAGADFALEDNTGKTPLQVAREQGSTEVVAILERLA